MERITTITPGWDKRDTNPKKNYGIHCCDLRMVLKGNRGAVQFILYTGWFPKHVQEEQQSKGSPIANLYPMPADVGYHSPIPMHEGHTPMGIITKFNEDYSVALGLEGTPEPCEFLEGRPCYYDGSSLAAQKVYDVMLERGSEGVWEYLGNYYKQTFGELD